MDLSIIIVTHNSIATVRDCLASIDEHSPACSFETIVVDNASADGTPELVAERFGSVVLAVNGENVGYSRGVNQGIRRSTGERILILNPDIIVTEGSIDRLRVFMDRTPGAGIAASKLVYPDGRLQYSCRSFYTLGALLLRRTFLGKLLPRARALRDHLLLDYDHLTARKVDWVLGACMMVRREALEAVGGMDERFFLYFEDIDWCFRMKNQGWSVFYVPESVMIHKYKRSSAGSMLRKPFIIHLLSMLRYYEKWNMVFYFFRRHRGTFKSLVFVLSDLIAINAGFFAAYLIRDLLQPLFVNSLYPLAWYRFFILFYNMIFFVTFLLSGLYRIRRETVWMEELLRVVRTVLMVMVILLASTYLTRVRFYSRAVLFGHAGISVAAVWGMRWIIRAVHRELVRARFDLKRVLLVGSREEALDYSKRITASAELGLDIVGRVGPGEGSLGERKDLPGIVDRFKVQEIMILPSGLQPGATPPFAIQPGVRLIQVKVVSDLARQLGVGVRVEELAGIHLFSIERGALFLAWRVFKRATDIVTALACIPLVSIVAPVYRLYGSLSGRVRFFTERRLGAGELELDWPRAVNVNGGEAGDLVKPRLFFYLLLGRISLVGPPAPRPSWPRSPVSETISALRPGITGRWRTNAGTGMEAALENEIFEIQSRSSTREIMILAQSFLNICKGVHPQWFNG